MAQRRRRRGRELSWWIVRHWRALTAASDIGVGGERYTGCDPANTLHILPPTGTKALSSVLQRSASLPLTRPSPPFPNCLHPLSHPAPRQNLALSLYVLHPNAASTPYASSAAPHAASMPTHATPTSTCAPATSPGAKTTSPAAPHAKPLSRVHAPRSGARGMGCAAPGAMLVLLCL